MVLIGGSPLPPGISNHGLSYYLSSGTLIITTTYLTMAANIPDYMLDPDAVAKDVEASWRNKTPPDYTKTRAFYKAGMIQRPSDKPVPAD